MPLYFMIDPLNGTIIIYARSTAGPVVGHGIGYVLAVANAWRWFT